VPVVLKFLQLRFTSKIHAVGEITAARHASYFHIRAQGSRRRRCARVPKRIRFKDDPVGCEAPD